MAKKTIRKILVPMDGSKGSFRALDEAIYLAKQCSATITSLCVIPDYLPIFVSGMTNSFKSKITNGAKKFLGQAKTRTTQNGIVFNEKIIYGVATEDIVNFANKSQIDLIVIGHRSHSSVREMFLGSVANATVHKSKIPVLVVK